MSLNFRLNSIRDYTTVCYQTRTFDTPEEATAFIRAESSYMGPNWAVDRDDTSGRTVIRMAVTTNMLIWASMLVGLPEITEANAERWFKRLATVEAHNGAYRTREGEDVFFTLDEVKAHVGPGDPWRKWMGTEDMHRARAMADAAAGRGVEAHPLSSLGPRSKS